MSFNQWLAETENGCSREEQIKYDITTICMSPCKDDRILEVKAELVFIWLQEAYKAGNRHGLIEGYIEGERDGSKENNC